MHRDAPTLVFTVRRTAEMRQVTIAGQPVLGRLYPVAWRPGDEVLQLRALGCLEPISGFGVHPEGLVLQPEDPLSLGPASIEITVRRVPEVVI